MSREADSQNDVGVIADGYDPATDPDSGQNSDAPVDDTQLVINLDGDGNAAS